MAEGGSGLAEGHEEFFDYVCGQCKAEDKVVEAIAYCPECHSFFCDTCLALHRRFLVTRKHEVLEENRKEEWGTAKRGPKYGRDCVDHDGQNVTMFCEDHKELCCPVCVSLDHRTCRNMAFIPHVAKGIASSTSLSQTKAKLAQFLESLTNAIATRSQDADAWRNSRAQVLDDIAIFRSKIGATLHQLEAKLRKEMDEFDNPFAAEIASDLTNYASMQQTLNGCRTALEKTETSSNEPELFIAMKLCQKKLSEFEEEIKKTVQPIRPRLVFAENELLLQEIKKATHIGDLEVETELTNKEYEVYAQFTENIKLPEDNNTCYIDGVVQMPNGQVIISDNRNKRLKILNASYNVVRYHDVPDKPYAMCRVSDTDIVVSIATSTLLFISIGDTIRNTKTIKLNHRCYGLAHHDGKLFVTNLVTLLYIYDMSGNRLQTIQHDAAGSNLFKEVRHVAVSANGCRIFVADKQLGLIVLDRYGQHLGTLSSPDMKGARSICLDANGNMFIACCYSHTLVQVDNRGRKIIRTLLEKKDGLNYPGVVLYSKDSASLLMANAPRAGNDTLTVLKMKIK